MNSIITPNRNRVLTSGKYRVSTVYFTCHLKFFVDFFLFMSEQMQNITENTFYTLFYTLKIQVKFSSSLSLLCIIQSNPIFHSFGNLWFQISRKCFSIIISLNWKIVPRRRLIVFHLACSRNNLTSSVVGGTSPQLSSAPIL